MANYSQIIYPLTGVATLMIIIGNQTLVLGMKTPLEISQMAQQVTVQINANSEDLPGGSGVIIAKNGNQYTVLTANHVVCENIPRSDQIECRSDLSYTVRTPNGQNYPITQIKSLAKRTDDPDLAVAVFESSQNLPVANLGNSNNSVIGTDVFVAGFPMIFGTSGANRSFSVVRGAVAQRPQNAQRGYSLVYDANTQTGISGGPVFDDNGQVVGIHGLGDTSGINHSKTGFNAAIPINTFKEICAQNSNCSQIEITVNPSPSSNTTASQTSLNNPQSGRDYYKKALVSQGREETQDAIKNYAQALENNPDESTAFLTYLNRGILYSNQKNWPAALEDFNQAIALNPNSPKPYTERANVFLETGNLEGALEDFNKAIALDPFYAPAYNDRAFIYNHNGDFFHAALDLKKAADLILSQGNVLTYITIVENQKTVERQDVNIRLLNRWGYTLAPCGAENVSILFDDKEYCISPVTGLNAGKYKYNRYQDKFEVISNSPTPPPVNEPESSSSSPPPTTNPVTIDTSNLDSIVKQFTFYNLWDYGNCVEDILQLYQGVENFKKEGRKSDCLPEIFAAYSETGLTKQQAVELIHAANVYATTVLYRRMYPPQGQRARIREMFGYVYEIDQK